MNKLIMLIVLNLYSISVGLTNEGNWSEIDSNKLPEKKVLIKGIVNKIKKTIKSRDNYFMIDLKDPESEKFILVKIYTIIKYKRINTLDCKVGDIISISGQLTDRSEKIFQLKKRKNQVGFITIKESDQNLKCEKPTPKE